MKRAILAAAFVLMLFGGVTRAQPATPAVDPSSFSTNVTNPYFPLPLGAVRVYEGWELDPETGEVHQNRVEETVLTETDTVMGVPVVVLQVMEYQDGELVEVDPRLPRPTCGRQRLVFRRGGRHHRKRSGHRA